MQYAEEKSRQSKSPENLKKFHEKSPRKKSTEKKSQEKSPKTSSYEKPKSRIHFLQ